MCHIFGEIRYGVLHTYRFAFNGLTASSCLVSLFCFRGSVCAADQDAVLLHQGVQVCAAISSLTDLTELSLKA